MKSCDHCPRIQQGIPGPCPAVKGNDPGLCKLAGEGRKEVVALVTDRYPEYLATLPEPPNLFQMAKSFVGAVASHVGAGMPTVDDATYEARLAICRSCEYVVGDVDGCRRCGCPGAGVRAKARWGGQPRCPENRWPPSAETGLSHAADEGGERLVDEADHAGDHFALSFAAGAHMALYDADGRSDYSYSRWLAGETVFLLGGGPSLADVDLGRLAGRKTLAMNNVIEIFPTPTAWLCVDDPAKFPVPWHVNSTLKLLPRAWALRESDGRPFADVPSVRFYLRNGRFDAERFVGERTVNWGSEKRWGGGRSVMLAALKLLLYFGASRVVLLGCDFHMDPRRPYAHSAPKDERGCKSNNRKFEMLNRRLIDLRPHLERAGMRVVNASPGPRLEAFERVVLEAELA